MPFGRKAIELLEQHKQNLSPLAMRELDVYKQVIELREQGSTYQEIVDQTGRTFGEIRRWANLTRLPLHIAKELPSLEKQRVDSDKLIRDATACLPFLRPEAIEELAIYTQAIEMSKEGIAHKDISQALEMSVSNISRWVSKRFVPTYLEAEKKHYPGFAQLTTLPRGLAYVCGAALHSHSEKATTHIYTNPPEEYLDDVVSDLEKLKLRLYETMNGPVISSAILGRYFANITSLATRVPFDALSFDREQDFLKGYMSKCRSERTGSARHALMFGIAVLMTRQGNCPKFLHGLRSTIVPDYKSNQTEQCNRLHAYIPRLEDKLGISLFTEEKNIPLPKYRWMFYQFAHKMEEGHISELRTRLLLAQVDAELGNRDVFYNELPHLCARAGTPYVEEIITTQDEEKEGLGELAELDF